MGFKKEGYCTIWEINNGKGNYMDVKISSRKKRDGEFYTDFSSYCLFIGEALRKVNECEIGTKIKILDCEVTNKYDKERKREFNNFLVYDFEVIRRPNERRVEK